MIYEKNTLLINCERQAVFDFLTDDSQLHTWVNGIVKITPVGEHVGGVGDKIKIQVNIPKEMEIISELVEWKPPKRFTVAHQANNLSGKMSYNLIENGSVTELHFEAEHKPQGLIMKILSPLIGVVIKKERKLELQRLKDKLEG